MTALLNGLMLLLFLVVADRGAVRKPLSRYRPLNLENPKLPWPLASHASSIFSLNALFGAYLVTAVVIGPVGIVGVAVGSSVALVLLLRAMQPQLSGEFENFLSTRTIFRDPRNTVLAWKALVVLQLLFATSEMLILAGISAAAFPLRAREAAAYAMLLSLVGYLYTLRGGYWAIFITDKIQLAFVIAMCLTFSANVLAPGPAINVVPLAGTPGWKLELGVPGWVEVPLLFLVGVVTGASFLFASPDAWKRVFLVGRQNRSISVAVWKLLAAGFLPFALIVPLALAIPRELPATANILHVLDALTDSPLLIMAFTLGTTASFLSSFDSVLLAATQLTLVTPQGPPRYALFHFQYRIAIAYLLVVALFSALFLASHNPYVLGIMIAGLYAVWGGVFFGTGGGRWPIRYSGCIWLLAILVVLWFQLVATAPGIFEAPHPAHMRLGVIGAGLGILAGCLSMLSRTRSPKAPRKDSE